LLFLVRHWLLAVVWPKIPVFDKKFLRIIKHNFLCFLNHFLTVDIILAFWREI
jgi:hypothetical protein